MNDEIFYHANDLTEPARTDLGMDVRQGASRLRSKPNGVNNDDVEDQDDDPKKGKEEKTSETNLGAMETDLLQYQFS